jgi:hypothetical protein
MSDPIYGWICSPPETNARRHHPSLSYRSMALRRGASLQEELQRRVVAPPVERAPGAPSPAGDLEAVAGSGQPGEVNAPGGGGGGSQHRGKSILSMRPPTPSRTDSAGAGTAPAPVSSDATPASSSEGGSKGHQFRGKTLSPARGTAPPGPSDPSPRTFSSAPPSTAADPSLAVPVAVPAKSTKTSKRMPPPAAAEATAAKTMSVIRPMNETVAPPVEPEPGDARLYGPAVGTRLRSLLHDIDPRFTLAADTEDLLLQMVDDFVGSLSTQSLKVAQHRSSNVLEVADVQLCLEKQWGMPWLGVGALPAVLARASSGAGVRAASAPSGSGGASGASTAKRKAPKKKSESTTSKKAKSAPAKATPANAKK